MKTIGLWGALYCDVFFVFYIKKEPNSLPVLGVKVCLKAQHLWPNKNEFKESDISSSHLRSSRIHAQETMVLLQIWRHQRILFQMISQFFDIILRSNFLKQSLLMYKCIEKKNLM